MRIPLASWTVLLISSSALTARAEPAASTGATEEPTPDSSERWQARTPQSFPDQRTGHFVASGSFGWVIPFGTVAADASQSARFGSGFAYQADLGYGIDSSAVVGLWGQLLDLGDGSACTDCAGSSYAGGLFIRYYLVQGLRFDPWLSFGIGYRFQHQEVAGVDRRYSGLDWARLQFGGDWYPIPQIGIGPWLELGAGTFFTRPEGERAGGLPLRFSVGIRVALDIPGH